MLSLDLNPEIEGFKAEMRSKIDAEAEAFRLRFVTPGAAQALTFLEKEKEALAVEADPAASAPHLEAEAVERGLTVTDMAARVLTTAAEWRDLSVKIEAMRIRHKLAIDAAATVADVVAASTPDWQSLVIP